MVGKNFFINIKSFGSVGSSLNIGVVDNKDNNDVLITGNNNNGNGENQNPKKPKYKYVKVLVDDPFNNRDIIVKVTKKQKGAHSLHTINSPINLNPY